MPRGIYTYQGHSFLIDKDIYSIELKDKEVSFIYKNNQIQVSYNHQIINSYKEEKFIDVIYRYWKILLGEFVNG